MLIKCKSNSDPQPSEITAESVYLNRRRFLKSGGAIAAALSLPTYAPAALGPLDNLPDSPYNTDEELTSETSVTTYNNFYELGYGKADPHKNAKYLKTEPWSIAVGGECDNPGTYTLEDFVKPHQLEDRVYRLRCVEAWSMVIPWIGFEVNRIIGLSKPTSKAKYVAFRSILDRENLPGQRRNVLDWPYKEGLRIDEAMHPLTIFAVGLYGKELPNQNGAPLRLVVPWKYGFKSIKSIVAMEFTEQQPPTAWGRSAPSEYGFYSNVNPEVDHPRWSQRRERRIGEFGKRDTLKFNGYEQEVASLYSGMDLNRYF